MDCNRPRVFIDVEEINTNSITEHEPMLKEDLNDYEPNLFSIDSLYG